MAPRKTDKEAKRKYIFDVALELFNEKSFDHTTMDDIAALAGIGKGTIYEYYKSKNEFIKEAYNYYTTPNKEILDIYYDTNMTPLAKIELLLKKLIEQLIKGQKISKIILNIWLKSSFKYIYPEINFKEIYSQSRNMIDDLLASAIVQGQVRPDLPKYSSSIILGMLEGLTLQFMADPNFANAEVLGNDIVDIIINGLIKK